MSVFTTIWIIVQILIGYNLLLPLVLYSIAKMKSGSIATVDRSTESDYAIIVTAYEQVALLPQVVNSLLALNYSNYLIYVVADNCDISTLDFNSDKVIVLRPEITLASNTKSHFYAIDRFKRKHERLTIIDSDNLVHPEYLNEMDRFFDLGFEAVQGVREPKNINTTFACLDAARDIYYHYYDGKLLFKAGSSATLSGSGMAFTTSLYRICLEHLGVSGAGFDKVLQFEIVKRGYRIAFAQKAIVYDEKTAKSDQLVKQRARWINTWFKYFSYGFTLIGLSLRRLNFNQFLFGWVLLRPPLFIFLILSVFCMMVNLFFFPSMALTWLIALVVFVLGFYIALANSNTDRKIYRSLRSIPTFVFYQLLSLSKARKANKLSVSTIHHTNNPER